MPQRSNPIAHPGGPSWRIGKASFDLGRECLEREGTLCPLDRSSLLVLRRLLERPGETVDKDLLLQAGWPGRAVTENSLTKAIGRLRQALGDEEGEVLRVIHGVGYRVVGAVPLAEEPPLPRPVEAGKAAQGPRRFPRTALALGLCGALGLGLWSLGARGHLRPSADAMMDPPSIAILPLADLSPNHDQGYFSDGLTDQLEACISWFQPIRVAGRASTFAYHDRRENVVAIGRDLGVGTVLDGSVRKEGDRLRVTLQLSETRTGFQLWTQTYDRPFKDLFALQDDIAKDVAGHLRLNLQPGQRPDMVGLHTKNPEAFEAFLLAHLVVRDDETGGRRTVKAYRRAVELDPTFYEAWLSLADALSIAQYPDDVQEALEGKKEAMATVNRAIAIAPDRPEAWLLRGDLRYCQWWDWQGAETDLEQGARLGFREKQEYLLREMRLKAALGHLDEAIALARHATELGPTATPQLVMAYHLTALDRHEEAEKLLTQLARVMPTEEHVHFYLGLGKLLRGRPAEALQHFDDSAYVFRLLGQAIAYHDLRDRQRSNRSLELLTQRYAHLYPFNIAEAYAYRNEKDQAFHWLDRACQQHDASIMYLLWDPLLRNLHGDPRFTALLRRVNLPASPILGRDRRAEGGPRSGEPRPS